MSDVTLKTSKNGRQTAKSFIWEKTNKSLVKGINIFEVPIESDFNDMVSLNSEKEGNSSFELLVFEFQTGYEAVVLEFIPNEEFRSNMKGETYNLGILKNSYSGILNLINPKTNSVTISYLFDAGKIIGKSTVGQSTVKSNKSGRLETYEVTVKYWVCGGGSCHIDYTVTYTYSVYTPDQTNYDQYLDPNDMYGGGGGSGTSESTSTYDYNITADQSITNDPKANCIYNKLLNNEWFNEILKAFENNGALNVTFKLGNLPISGDNGVAQTSSPFNNIEIIIDYTRLQNHTTLEGARTFLHEAIHAKIYSYMYLNGILSYEELNETNFKDLWEAYVISKANGTSAQHELMANKYIDLIAEGLKIFDIQNLNNPDVTLDHYKALAWDGLRKTQAYISLSQTQKDKIDNDRMSLMWNTYINCN